MVPIICFVKCINLHKPIHAHGLGIPKLLHNLLLGVSQRWTGVLGVAVNEWDGVDSAMRLVAVGGCHSLMYQAFHLSTYTQHVTLTPIYGWPSSIITFAMQR